MHSKFTSWDFVTNYPETIKKSNPLAYVFLVTDPYLEKSLLDRLPKKELNFQIYFGNEMTIEKLEDLFLNLNLFFEERPLLILNAEGLKSDCINFLIENKILENGQLLCLFFSKSNKEYLRLTKLDNDKLNVIEIENPKFWEGQKIWQLSMKLKNVNYPSNISQLAMLNFEHTFKDFFQFIDLLKINFEEKNIDVNQVNLLIKKERWDYFELISSFQKNPMSFLETILSKEIDYDWFRGLFSLLQNHLVKVIFPNEIIQKKKHTKYELDLLEYSKKANLNDLKYFLKIFSEWEILAKSQSEFLLDKIRFEYLLRKRS